MVAKDNMPQVMVNYLDSFNQYHARKTTISSVNEVMQNGVATEIGIAEAWLYQNYQYSQHESDRLFLSKIFGKYQKFCAENKMRSIDNSNFSKNILFVISVFEMSLNMKNTNLVVFLYCIFGRIKNTNQIQT